MTKKTCQFQPLITPIVSWEKSSLASSCYGECVMSPLEPGFGVTFGNTLRRILLGGIEGTAVTSIIIKGINNEFSVLNGVIEDVMNIILNIKGLVIKNSDGRAGELKISTQKSGVITAGDFECSENLEIVNKDLLIATLADNGSLDMILFVETGRGYLPAKWPLGKKLQEDNRIYVDAMFAPVVNVAIDVQKTRIGSEIDYDKLILSITTNGSLTPGEALQYAISVAINQFNSFLSNTPFISFDTKDNNAFLSQKDESRGNNGQYNSVKNSIKEIENILSRIDGVEPQFFFRSIDFLNLPARVHNSLLASGIRRIIDLINSTEQEVINIKNLGKKSFEDLVQNMKDYNLSFSMNIDENILLNYMEKNKNVTQQ